MKPKSVSPTRSHARLWLPILVLLAGLMITFGMWNRSRAALKREVHGDFDAQSRDALTRIEARLRYYEQALLGTRGLFKASESVTRGEFATYVAGLDLAARYPGIQGIGFAVLIPADEKERHLSQIRRQGFPNYQLRPPGNRERYSSIIYLEPFDDRNQRALGYDMLSEPVRREALSRAQETGQTSMSGKVKLVQETATDIQAGFLIYVPLSPNGRPAETVADRRRNLVGWVYAPFRMNDLMHGVLGEGPTDLDIEIYDGPADSPNTLMFDRSPAHSTLRSNHTLSFGGHVWTVVTQALPGLVARHRDPSAMSASLGSLMSLLLGVLTFLIVGWLGKERRASAVLEEQVEARTRELRESAASYRNQFVANSSVMLLIDLEDGTILDANAAALTFYGYPQEQLLAMRIADINVLPAGELRQAMASVPQSQGQRFEFQHRLADGSLRNVEVSASNILFGDRMVVHSIIHDITVRIHAEKLRHEMEQRLSYAMDAAEEGIWDWDIGTGRVKHNARWCRLLELGDDFQEHPLTLYASMIQEDDRPRVMEAIQGCLEGLTPYVSEHRLLSTEGKTLWVMDRGRVVERDEAGAPIRMVGAMTDITLRKQAEALQQEALDRLQKIASRVPGLVYQYRLRPDGSSCFPFASDAIRTIYGVSPEDVRDDASKVFANLCPEDYASVAASIQASARDLTPWQHEYRVKFDDGTIRTLFGNAIPEREEDGSTLWHGFITDITERKKVDEHLSVLTSRLSLAARAGGVGIWDYDTVHNVLVWDAQMYRIYGIREDQFSGAYEAWQSGLHPEDRARGDAEIQSALSGEQDFDTEFRVIWPDGSTHFVRAYAMVERDAMGQPLRMIGTNWDITVQRRNEEALRESQERFRQLAEVFPETIFETDVSGRLTYTNEHGYRTFGVTLADLDQGINVLDMVAPADRPQVLQRIQERIAGGDPAGFLEYSALLGDGTTFDAMAYSSPITQNGSVVGLRGFILDISERKRMEMELQASMAKANDLAFQALNAVRAKSEFLANMSHEIRTPMNGVLGMAELLTDLDLTPDQAECVSAINRSGESLLALLNDILDFSKMEAGQMTLESVPFDLEQVVFEVADLFRGKVEGTTIELLVDFEPSTPAQVRGDPGRFRQVLNNLVSNAIKFTEAGHVLIEVRATPLADGRLNFHVAVQDTGIGIPLDKQARLFQPFTQADTSTSRRFGGTGLGLVLVKRIAEAMGGCVRLESQDGRGTTLFVDLPLEADADPKEAPAGGAELAGKRILVIDDLAINRTLQRRQIEAHGGIALSAPSGVEALQAIDAALIRGEPFDAALVDLHMPRMDGLTFAKRVRSDPRCRSLALVVLTATKVRGEAAKMEAAGFDGFLLKPVMGGTLARALVAAVQRVEGGSAAGVVTRHSMVKAQKINSPDTRLTLRGRILLVEDQEVNQAVARKLLESAGATVEVAENGRVALEKVANQAFDVVLMDCQMPEMDGFEATERIRALEAGTGRHIPILAMTAHAMAGDRDRCLAAGMDDYLTKPISREVLVRCVAGWLPPQAEQDLEATLPEVPSGFPPAAPELELDEVLFQKLWEVFDRNGKEMGAVVIEPFVRRGEELLQALRLSVAVGDVKGIRSAAHALKGSSRTLALNALGRIAEHLEQEGGTASPATLGAWVEDADQAFQSACRYLRTLSGG